MALKHKVLQLPGDEKKMTEQPLNHRVKQRPRVRAVDNLTMHRRAAVGPQGKPLLSALGEVFF